VGILGRRAEKTPARPRLRARIRPDGRRRNEDGVRRGMARDQGERQSSGKRSDRRKGSFHGDPRVAPNANEKKLRCRRRALCSARNHVLSKFTVTVSKRLGDLVRHRESDAKRAVAEVGRKGQGLKDPGGASCNFEGRKGGGGRSGREDVAGFR